MKKRIGLIILIIGCLLFLGGCGSYIIELDKDGQVPYRLRVDYNEWQYDCTQDVISEDGNTREITLIFTKK